MPVYAVFRLEDDLYGLPVSTVREMLRLAHVSSVPHAADHVLGVTNLRGRVVPVVSVRNRLGLRADQEVRDEFVDLMDRREQDHLLWFEALEASVREGREFTLARDPHQCAFGKWYDNFHTSDNDLAAVLRGFDRPHQRFHAAADAVLAIAARGDSDGALALLEQRRLQDLAVLRRKFEEARQTLRDRQLLAVVVEFESCSCALAVDGVEWVGDLRTEPLPPIGETGRQHFEGLVGIGHSEREQRPVMLLDGLSVCGL